MTAIRRNISNNDKTKARIEKLSTMDQIIHEMPVRLVSHNIKKEIHQQIEEIKSDLRAQHFNEQKTDANIDTLVKQVKELQNHVEQRIIVEKNKKLQRESTSARTKPSTFKSIFSFHHNPPNKYEPLKEDAGWKRRSIHEKKL